MKKILMFLVIFLSFSVLFAAVDANAQMGSADSTKTEGDEVKAYVEVKVSIGTSEEGEQGSDDAGQKVVVGFKKSALTNTATNITTSVDDAYTGEDSISMKLEPDYSVAHLSADTPLHAFWQIQSANSVKVDLGATPLTGTKNAGNKLGLTIKSGESDVLTVASTDSAKTTEDGAIHIHNGSSAMGTAGSKPLTLTTTSYADFPGDTFTGTITVTVTVDDAAEAVEEG